MGDEPEDARTLKDKALFYTTAFFVLLGTFSLFAFLFLVPFVIDPAFTTIFLHFDINPAYCETVRTERYKGVLNCSSGTSCKEGCTKEVYECTQIYVNYKIWKPEANRTDDDGEMDEIADTSNRIERAVPPEYNYADSETVDGTESQNDLKFKEYPDSVITGLQPNDSEWYYTEALLFPNVKGCGYPPMLNCSIWSKKYHDVGSNFSCYYSKIDPRIVISDLDMWQNTLNLIYAMAIPIPSFIISVIYLTFAYFKIYNEDEETVPLDQNAECIAGDDPSGDECLDNGIIPNGTASIAPAILTPTSDLTSFGHQLKVKMADEMSRESLDAGFLSNSGSLQGNLSKTMTTSISTPPGPIAAV